jgi:hypothetical protein
MCCSVIPGSWNVMDSCGIFPLLLNEPKEPCRKISLGTQSSKNPMIFLQSKGGINLQPTVPHEAHVLPEAF